MKNSLLLMYLICCCIKPLSAQEKTKTKLDLMQGAWRNIMNSEVEKAFTIIKGKFSLSFVYDTSARLDFPLSESVKGFYSEDVEVDSLSLGSLMEDGSHYVVVDKNDIRSNGWFKLFLIPKYFECDEELMSIGGGQLVEFSKQETLPFEAVNKLYKRGNLDKKNYLKEYLNLTVSEVKPLTCMVYEEPNEKMKFQLNQGDIVIVIEYGGKWIKIRYNENSVGWMKRKDVKQ